MTGQVSKWLPHLTWREVVEHPAVKDKLQSRDVGERQAGVNALITAAATNPAHAPKVGWGEGSVCCGTVGLR